MHSKIELVNVERWPNDLMRLLFAEWREKLALKQFFWDGAKGTVLTSAAESTRNIL